MSMQDSRKADQIATERAEMLGPLLTPGLVSLPSHFVI
jgi:hypothetical protein